MENKWNEIVKHSSEKPNDNAMNWETFSRIFLPPPSRNRAKRRKGKAFRWFCVFALIFVNATWTNFIGGAFDRQVTGRVGVACRVECECIDGQPGNQAVRHSFSYLIIHSTRHSRAVKQSKVSIKMATAKCHAPPRPFSTLLFYYIWFKHSRYRHMRSFPHTLLDYTCTPIIRIPNCEWIETDVKAPRRPLIPIPISALINAPGRGGGVLMSSGQSKQFLVQSRCSGCAHNACVCLP